MALGVLAIIYAVLIIVAIIIQVLLYKSNDESRNGIFIINMLFALILAFIAYTSLPTNFVGERILAVAWAIISILAIIIKFKFKQFTMASKIILSLAIVGGLAQLFL